MNQPRLDTSSKWRFTAAAFAFAAIAGFWSSPVAHADDSDDDAASAAGPSEDALQNAKNPYVSGPLANVGGPNTGGGGAQQDPSQALGGLLNGGGQGMSLDSVGQLLNGGGDGMSLDSVGQLLNGGGQGMSLDSVGQLLNGGGAAASGDQSGNQIPEVVRKGVRALNRALGDKGFNSQEPGPTDGQNPAPADDEDDDD